jgi:hypothetical protein
MSDFHIFLLPNSNFRILETFYLFVSSTRIPKQAKSYKRLENCLDRVLAVLKFEKNKAVR